MYFFLIRIIKVVVVKKKDVLVLHKYPNFVGQHAHEKTHFIAVIY